MFDTYTLKARLYPVVILFAPIAILGVFYSYEFQSLVHFIYSVGILGALTYLFSQLGRDPGKSKEKKLWQCWGGMPSAQLLRLKNNIIDCNTKNRYHKKMIELCPVEISPSISMEDNNPIAADGIYAAWTRFLISKTRNIKEFSLLFKENVNYGFRRNLWGLKVYAIFFILISVTCNYIYWAIDLQTLNLINFPKSFLFSTVVILGMLFFWLLVVSKEWVRIAAFSYAERLCEAIENI